MVTSAILLSVVLWILFGALAGWLAGMIMGSSATQSFWVDALYGIVGGLIGGFVLSLFGLHAAGMFWSVVTAVIGAVILIAIVRAVQHQPLRTVPMGA